MTHPPYMSVRKNIMAAAEANPNSQMLWCNGEFVTFAEGLEFNRALAQEISFGDTIALISDKNKSAYLTIFSSIVVGATYIPVNKSWNTDRIASVLRQTMPEFIACDSDWANEHQNLITDLGYLKTALVFNNSDNEKGIFVFKKLVKSPSRLSSYKKQHLIDDLLYVMFTSGSTGEPKGVPVARASVDHYVGTMISTFQMGAGERWIQAVELNFDLSVHDMLLAWNLSGCVVSIPADQSPMGPRFVKKLNVQNWLSVPSSAARSFSLGLLKNNYMPSLKRSFFCGEALPTDIAIAWSKAAPQAPVINIFGPTEATIAFSWHGFSTNDTAGHIVPIGKPLSGLDMRLSEFQEIELAGPQVFSGYLENEEENRLKLVPDLDGKIWYKTGDKGAISQGGVFEFVGRIDWQVKVRGNRIEIAEVELAIRRSTGCGMASVVPINCVAPGSYGDLVAFVDKKVDSSQLKPLLNTLIPRYMIPEFCLELVSFPHNSNGKVDRNALIEIAERNFGKNL